MTTLEAITQVIKPEIVAAMKGFKNNNIDLLTAASLECFLWPDKYPIEAVNQIRAARKILYNFGLWSNS